MAAIVAGATFNDNGSSYGEPFDVAVPAGTTDGDLLIAVNVSEWNTIADSPVPAGFTPLTVSSYDGGGNSAHVPIGYRIASSEPASYTFESDGTGGSSNVGAIVRITGHESTPTIAQVAPIGDTSFPTCDAPSIVPNADDDLLLTIYGGEIGNTAATWTPPAGMTEVVDHCNPAHYAALLIASLASPPSPSGVRTATLSSGGEVIGGCTISIASGGGAPAPHSGSAVGSWTVTGSASGSTSRSGSATGVWSFTGSATGSAPAIDAHSGSAAGSWSVTGTASGSTEHRGSGSGSTAFTGSAQGSTAHRGAASGQYAVEGSASGSTAKSGQAAGSFQFEGTATGHAPSVNGAAGTAAGSWSFTGTASGSTRHAGTATGGWSVTGQADGSTERHGTATGIWTFTGSAAGHAPGLVTRDIRVIEVGAPALAASTTSPEAGVLAALSPGVAASTTGPGTALSTEEPTSPTPWATTEAALTATTTEPADGWDLAAPER